MLRAVSTNRIKHKLYKHVNQYLLEFENPRHVERGQHREVGSTQGAAGVSALRPHGLRQRRITRYSV